MLSRSFGRKFFTATVALAVLAWLGAPLAAQQMAPFECNAAVNLSLANPTPMPGETVEVRVQLVNGPSTDVGDMPIPQDYSLISFFPNCTGTVPCTVDPAALVSFVSPTRVEGPGCPAVPPMVLVNDLGTGEIQLTFNPDPLTVAAAAVNTGTNRCSIYLDVQVDPMAMAGAMTNLEADTVGTCTTGSGAPQSATGTTTLEVQAGVPTLGEFALALLALILAVGSWLVLRRRSIGNATGV